MGNIWLYLLIGVGIGGAIASIIWLPKRQTRKAKVMEDRKERWRAENEFRKTLAQIFGGLLFIVGIFVSWQQFNRSQANYKEQLKQSKEELLASKDQFRQSQEIIKAGQIATRFNQSFTHLSNGNTTGNIGAVYALEQIAKESPSYLQTVLDVLTEFVRNFEYLKYQGKKEKRAVILEKLKNIDKSKGDNQQKEAQRSQLINDIKPFPEVQKALTVIGRIRVQVLKTIDPGINDLTQKITEAEKELLAFKIKNSFVEIGVGEAKVIEQYKQMNASRHELKQKLNDKLSQYPVDLSGTTLINADLNKANLSGANLTEANLTRANLRGANLYRAKLTGANLSGADLTRADLTEANLIEAKLTKAELFLADLTEAKLTKANLFLADLTEAKLNGAYLRGADFTAAKLTRANLTGADLYRANLTRANLRGADLRGAKLTRADLRGAKLWVADLRGVDLTKAKLWGVDLAKAKLTNTVGLTYEQLLDTRSLYGAIGLSADLESKLKKERPVLWETRK